MAYGQHKGFVGSPLNTLAQTGTAQMTPKGKKPPQIAYGNGSDITDSNKQYRRSKKKLIGNTLLLQLIDIAHSKGQRDRVKEYWNSYHCLNKVYCQGGKMYGKYCKNRICPVCSGNRKAELINKYYPFISQWKDAYFVTITLKSVPAKKLKNRLVNMCKAFQLITMKYRKRQQRGKGFALMGVKSLECNFNPIKRTYNPHFHIIVPDERTADIIISEWRHYCNRRGIFRAHWKAQDKRPVTDMESCMIEVIKYGSKIFTRPDMDYESPVKIPHVIYIRAIHNILTAMKGFRLFERFGFNLPRRAKAAKSQILLEYDLMTYNPQVLDWVDSESELRLSDYNLPPEYRQFLARCIDTKME